jgi:hypothetical protein
LSILGGRFATWLTAWLNIIGQCTVTAAIDFGLAEFLSAPLGFNQRFGRRRDAHRRDVNHW